VKEPLCSTLPNDFVELWLVLAGHNLGESVFIMDSRRACQVSMVNANRFDTTSTFNLCLSKSKSLTTFIMADLHRILWDFEFIAFLKKVSKMILQDQELNI